MSARTLAIISMKLRFTTERNAAFGLALLATALCACATPPPLRLATGSPGGTFHTVGEDLADFCSAGETRVFVRAIATTGSNENLQLLSRGKADLALVTQDALEAYLKSATPGGSREADRSGADPADSICVVGPLYVGAAQYVIVRRLVKSGTLGDLEGATLYPGARGSGTEEGTTRILDALNLKPRLAPSEQRTLGYAAAADALARGDYDAVVLSGGPPVGAVARLFTENPGRFQILSFTPDQIARATRAVPGLYASKIAPGVYVGQTEEIRSVGKRTLLVARKSLSASAFAGLQEKLERGIAEPDRGLRAPRRHPLLRSLTPAFWHSPLEIPTCLGASPNG